MRSILRLAAWTITAASAISAGGCAAPRANAESAQPPVPVRAVSARPVRFARVLDLSGTIVASHSVTVGATAAGRIVELRVRVGDTVSTGQVLAQIDAAPYRAALSQAQGSATAAAANEQLAVAQLDAAQSRAHLALATARRMSSLYAQGAISKQQQDESQAEAASADAGVAQARAQIAAAQGQIAQSQGGLASAEVPLQDTTIRAPFPGVVTAQLIDAGAAVSPGSPIVAIENDGDLEVDLSVPEQASPWLTANTPLAVRVDALGGRQIEGRIRAIVPSQDGLHSVLVKVSIPATAGVLPGMYARVALSAGAPVALAVPSSAVVDREGQSGVFTIRNGRAHFLPLETGATANGYTQVRGVAGSLSQVAADNTERLTDGAAVSVQPR